MPSKRSRPSRTRSSRSSAARTCSEKELRDLAEELGEIVTVARRSGGPIPRILLTGPMGAGKSTLARLILEALGVDRPSEGSPTFALAHEYGTAGGMAVSHADLYRLKTELELEETGLMEQFWDPGRLVLVEWMDQFPDTMAALQGSGLPILAIRLEFTEAGAGFRRITLMRSD